MWSFPQLLNSTRFYWLRWGYMTSKNTTVSRLTSLSAQNCKIWDGSFTRKCWSLYSYIWARVSSLRKQPTFGDVSTGFPAKWRLRNERRNSILMTRHHPDLGSASDWSYRVGNLIQPIRSTTQMWVETRYQYGIFSDLSLVFKIEKKLKRLLLTYAVN